MAVDANDKKSLSEFAEHQYQVMFRRGIIPEFSYEVLAELE